MNRTGIDMSPEDAEEMIQGVSPTGSAKDQSGGADGPEQALASYRERDMTEAAPIGSVPMPGTLKGVAKTGLQKLMGNQPEVLIDKLAGRLAFERTGTRLYDALVGKCSSKREAPEGLPLEQLLTFRNDEARHFTMLWDAIRELGADPTAQTPEADINGVASLGLAQIVGDPRTSIAQSIHAIHLAELADHDGWELLIQLTREMGHREMAERFEQALREESKHLEAIRQVLQRTTLAEAGR